MLLLAFLLIPAIFAVEQEITINNHIVKIDGKTLITVTSTPASSPMLNLSGLGLQNLAENAFENLMSLTNLDLGNNRLSAIPKQLFSKLGNLKHLSLANNNLTNFERIFEGLNNLETLNISNNPLNSLKATALSGVPKSSVVFTKGLSLEMINAFVFEKEPGPSVKRNDINKRSISDDQNPPTQIQQQGDPAQMEDRRGADLENNSLIKICIDGDVLKRVEFFKENEALPSNCRRGQLNNHHLLDLNNLGIAKFEKNWYGFDTTTPIKQIHLIGNNIVHVTPELINDLPANVRNVDLASNKIERLEKDILNNTYIRVINFRSNVIREIEDGAFTKMPSLVGLNVAYNLLGSTRFMATLPRTIEILFVQRNKITEISRNSFSTLRRLIFLHLDGNLIQEVKSDSFHGLRRLRKLVLSNNLISKIQPKSFQPLKNMYAIELKNNRIVHFENGTFFYMRGLENLDVSYNKLSNIKTSFPDGVPSNLTILNLGFNKIKKLDSDNFKNVRLTHLVLSGNKITAIELGALELPALRELHLDNNILSQLNTNSFRGLNNMEALNLAHNNITSIPERFTANLNHLEELDLSYNPIYQLQNGALYGFRKTAQNKVLLKGVPVKMIEGGLFDDMSSNSSLSFAAMHHFSI